MTEENKVMALSEYIEEFMLPTDPWLADCVHTKAVGRLQTTLKLIVDELYDIKSELAEDNLELPQIIGIADDYQKLAQEFSAYWYLLSGEDLDEGFITKLLYTEPKPELEAVSSPWDNHWNYCNKENVGLGLSNELTIDNSYIDFTPVKDTLTINTDEAGFGQIIINVSK